MTPKDFVIWLKGYLKAVQQGPDTIYNDGITEIVDKLDDIEDLPVAKKVATK